MSPRSSSLAAPSSASKNQISEPALRELARFAAAVAAGDEAGAAEAVDALRDAVSREAVYEAALQTHLFAGFPAAINGLLILSERWPSAAPHPRAHNTEPRAGERWRIWRERGERLCARIYGPRYTRLRGWMRSLSPELDEWMIVDGYGKTLARPGLSAAERELCAVAALAARGAVRQLDPHLEGAERLGLARAFVREVARDALRHVDPARRARLEALVGRRASASRSEAAGEGEAA